MENSFEDNAGIQVTAKYRKVSLDHIIVGPNKRGTAHSRLIVPEENNPDFVKEYTKKKDIYYCVACNRKGKLNSGKILYNYFLTPSFHYSWCIPIRRITAEQKNFIKQSRMSGLTYARSNSYGTKKPNKCTAASKLNSVILKDNISSEETTTFYNRKRLRSPSVEYISTVVSPRKKPNVEAEARPNNSYNTEPEHFNTTENRLTEDTLPDPTQKYSPNVSEKNDEIIPPAINPVPNNANVSPCEPPKHCNSFYFNYPSTSWLKKACKKMNLKYTQNAYKFWGNIDINEIKDISKPEYVQLVKGGKNSCFRALSYLLSGEENKEVKVAIRTYFYDNFSTLGTIAGCDFATLTIHEKVIKDTILSEEMTPILWETIAKWLKCRIGIFEDGKFSRFGSWSKNDDDDDDEIITLLFEKVRGNYSIIMELTEI